MIKLIGKRSNLIELYEVQTEPLYKAKSICLINYTKTQNETEYKSIGTALVMQPAYKHRPLLRAQPRFTQHEAPPRQQDFQEGGQASRTFPVYRSQGTNGVNGVTPSSNAGLRG